MLTFDKDGGFIHADMREETEVFSVVTITIDGDWYRVGEITEDENSDYRVAVEEIAAPKPIQDVKSFFTMGENKLQQTFEPRK